MEANRVLTVHWKEHSQQLSQGLWDLFNKEYMVDTNVSFYGDTFKVHSLLLTVFLPAFNKMSSNKSVKEVNLDYVANQKEDVQSLVEFIYTGKTTIAEDRIEYVRSLAQDLDFKGFTSSIEECEQSETDGISVENYSCVGLASVVEEDEPSTDVVKLLEENESSTTLNKNVKTSPGDIESVECRVSLTKMDTCKMNVVSPTVKTVTKMPIKRTSVRVMADKPSSSELTVSSPVSVNSRTRSGSSALTTADDENKKLVLRKSSAEEIEDAVTETSEQEDSDWNVSTDNRRKIRRKNYRKTSRVPMKCGNCEYETENKSAFKRHVKEHGHENLKCEKCNKQFKGKTSFWIHRNTSCGQDLKFVCNYCGHRTLLQATLVEHLAAIHKVDLKGTPLEENVKCTKCDFVCFAKHQLKQHVLRKHNDKKFECPQCEYVAAVSSELKRHISIRHLKERNYICDECGVSFLTSGALNVHIRSKHKGMKPYKCNHCDKEYICHTSYKIHMSKHTGTEKLFVCHVCGHSCNKRYNLGIHLKRLHGLKIEPIKKDFAPRQNITREGDSVPSMEEAKVASSQITS